MKVIELHSDVQNSHVKRARECIWNLENLPVKLFLLLLETLKVKVGSILQESQWKGKIFPCLAMDKKRLAAGQKFRRSCTKHNKTNRKDALEQ